MTAVHMGDLAQSFLFRRQAVQLRTELSARGQELSTGRSADLTDRLGGDTARLAALDRELALAATLRQNQAQAANRSAAMQAALGRVQSATEPLAATLRSAAAGGLAAELAAAGSAARGAFEDTVGALNQTTAGRSLFAGAATTGPALAGADAMLNTLRAEIGAETDAARVAQIVEDWFAPGGGFDSSGYLGADSPASPVPLGGGDEAALDIRADAPALRQVLAASALATLAADAALNLPEDTVRALFDTAAERLGSAGPQLIGLRADLGAEEARIERAGARIEAAADGARRARTSLIEVDGYEAATRMEALSQKLESLYAVTARLSRLTLLEAMR